MTEWWKIHGFLKNPADYTFDEVKREIEEFHSGNSDDFEEETPF